MKVAIVADARGNVGAGLVAAYRARGWSVVASAPTIGPADDPGVLAIEGGVAERDTADLVVDAALDRFGRIDTVVGTASVGTAKPFTDYTPASLAVFDGTLAGLIRLAHRAISELAVRYGGHVVNVVTAPAEAGSAHGVLTSLAVGGLTAATRAAAAEYADYDVRVNAVVPARARHDGGSGFGDAVEGVLYLESSPGRTGTIWYADDVR
ncbi:SDR family oxidoreductase [Streptomyces sp. NPDC046821]|uniref:SDR family oxidoreductase n=1 Tax=Streptomyces sp. NPDC046821 TaxID=3154702 RepID=UPI0033CF9B4E